MIPLALVVAGFVALAAGWVLLRRMGPGARIGQILAATPLVPVSRAKELADRGDIRYVAVAGRVDSAEEFEDENQRPLVYRRTRLELRAGRRWTSFEDVRKVAPFGISEGLDRIAVDGDALADGLVVVSRESVGTAADLEGIADRVPPGTRPETPARVRIELLTSVDHARVLGVPTVDPERGTIMRPGMGRPLVVTNLEPAEAMRLLGAGRRGTTRAISVLLGGGTAAIMAGVAWAVVDALV